MYLTFTKKSRRWRESTDSRKGERTLTNEGAYETGLTLPVNPDFQSHKEKLWQQENE